MVGLNLSETVRVVKYKNKCLMFVIFLIKNPFNKIFHPVNFSNEISKL